MYRQYPKKQDHGTRGSKWESTLYWGNYKKGLKLSAKELYRRYKNRVKQALRELANTHCTDEDIEVYYLRSQYRWQDFWYEFD